MEYQFESIGPALRWIVLAFLFVFVIAIVAAIAGIAALPGWIARRRHHPQAAAINVCGWFGLPSGVLWVLAMVWAYLKSSNAQVSESREPKTTLGASDDEVRRMHDIVTQLESTVARLEGKTQ